ncbi:Nuf2 family-domain-containing protein [Amanita rubescens]|nr:Nuf2 family-domain-containing protein [Amanita rubescens]
MAKGIYPPMTVVDVIASLDAWGIAVSQEQLSRPTQDFVEALYCACLRQAAQLDHNLLKGPVQELLDSSQLEEKDLYATALNSNILLLHLSRFAKAARIESFSSKDIFSPERERTLNLLSGFINFVKFTEQYCSPFVLELRGRSDALLVDKKLVYEQLLEVRQKLDELKAKIAEDEPICEKLRSENNALRAKMFATKEFQTAAVQEVEKLKSEKNALIKRREALHGEMTSISDAISHTRSRVVQSPERIKRTISTMAATALEEKKIVTMHESKVRDLQAKVNAVHVIEKDIRSCFEQLQSIEKEVRLLEVSGKEGAELHDQLDDKTIERNELRLRQERVEKQLTNAHEKIERAQKHAEDKKLANQRTNERLQREYDEMVIERRDNDKQLEELRREADNIEAKMLEHLKKSEVELNELFAEYWKLRHEAGKYNTEILDIYMETLANKLNMKVVAD